jgi:predicted secreted protein
MLEAVTAPALVTENAALVPVLVEAPAKKANPVESVSMMPAY